MNEYKQQFEAKKDEILTLLSKAEQVFAENGKSDRADVFKSLATMLQNGEFSIVVVGEFSAGKSTFLNALMGERILPSFTSETTATVNFLKHSSKASDGEEGMVYYSDGTEPKKIERADFETISKYVSTSSDIKVAAMVDHLDLYLDSKFLEEGIMLVDSPGLNGVADGHREITEKQIERSSASIFMFRADQPGSKTDFEFLRGLKNKVNTIIFVLNKIDEIKKSENETVEGIIDKIKENYKNQFPDDTEMPEIIGVASYPALVARSKENLEYRDRTDYSEAEKNQLLKNSKFEEFENRLWKFLTNGEKAYKMLLEPVERTYNLIDEETKKINSEIEILNGKSDTQEIRDQIIEIKKKEQELNEKADEIKHNVETDVRNAGHNLKNKIGAEFENIRKRHLAAIEAWETIDDYENYCARIDNSIANDINRIAASLSDDFRNEIEEITSLQYSNIAENINAEFGDISVSIRTKYESTAGEFDSGLDRYENKIEECDAEIQRLNQELEQAEDSTSKARMLKLRKDKLEAELDDAKKEKRIYEMNFTPPAREYHTEIKVEREFRDGILGGLATLLIGKKRREYKVTVDNSDEIRSEIERHNEVMKSYDAEVNEKQKQYDSVEETDPARAELNERRKARELAEAKGKRNQIEKDFFEGFKKRQERYLRAERDNIGEYIDSVTSQAKKEFSHALRAEQSKIAGAIYTAVNIRVANELNICREERESWENKLNQSEADRNTRIEELETQRKSLEELNNDVVILKVKLAAEQETSDTVLQSIE